MPLFNANLVGKYIKLGGDGLVRLANIQNVQERAGRLTINMKDGKKKEYVGVRMSAVKSAMKKHGIPEV